MPLSPLAPPPPNIIKMLFFKKKNDISHQMTAAQRAQESLQEEEVGPLSPARSVHQPAKSLHDLLYHASDSQVRPIVLNKRIDASVLPACDPARLQLSRVMSMDEAMALSPEDIESFIRELYENLAGKIPGSEKMNTLAYIEELSGDTSLADVFLNSALLKLFCSMLKQTKIDGVRLRIVHLIGESPFVVDLVLWIGEFPKGIPAIGCSSWSFLVQGFSSAMLHIFPMKSSLSAS